MSDPAGARLHERRPHGRRSWAFDVALALVAAGGELVQVTSTNGTASVPVIVLAVVAGGALALCRTAPLAVLATTLAATVGVVVLGGDPAGAAALIALYTTAAFCERRVSLAALAPTVVVAVVLSASTADVEGRETSALGGAVTVAVLAVGLWGLGAYAQTRRRYLRELERVFAAS